MVAVKSQPGPADRRGVDPHENDNLLDREAILERVGGDVEFLQEIAGLFAEDCPKLLTQIRSAVSTGDPVALEHAAHTLKGSVSNFGAEPARQAALRVEMLGRNGDLAQAPEACSALEMEMQRFTAALTALARQLGQG
jgi:HPt (histidine-containing phosphotransfer) domain-containing protein